VCGRKKLPFAGYSIVKEPKLLVRGSPGAPVLDRPPILLAPARYLQAGPFELSCPFTSALRAAVDNLRVGLPPEVRRVSSRAKGGGEYRARTGDLLVANQALSQLS
jgi:hypothetical protein